MNNYRKSANLAFDEWYREIASAKAPHSLSYQMQRMADSFSKDPKSVRKVIKYAIIVAITAIILILTVYAMFGGFFVHREEEYSLVNAYTTEEMAVYELDFDLSGYNKETLCEDEHLIWYIYTKDNESITFMQVDDLEARYNSEDSVIEEVTVNGKTALKMITADGDCGYTIYNPDCIITVSSNLGEELTLRLAESVKPMNK